MNVAERNVMLPAIIAECTARGYALALHGDPLTLTAVPWCDAAAPAADLLDALRLQFPGVEIRVKG